MLGLWIRPSSTTGSKGSGLDCATGARRHHGQRESRSCDAGHCPGIGESAHSHHGRIPPKVMDAVAIHYADDAHHCAQFSAVTITRPFATDHYHREVSIELRSSTTHPQRAFCSQACSVAKVSEGAVVQTSLTPRPINRALDTQRRPRMPSTRTSLPAACRGWTNAGQVCFPAKS
jgi:hypothetical protein